PRDHSQSPQPQSYGKLCDLDALAATGSPTESRTPVGVHEPKEESSIDRQNITGFRDNGSGEGPHREQQLDALNLSFSRRTS
ncbi:hypothetical protein LTR95_019462, partial [Oleoguttula sp. CCFEE 5521]